MKNELLFKQDEMKKIRIFKIQSPEGKTQLIEGTSMDLLDSGTVHIWNGEELLAIVIDGTVSIIEIEKTHTNQDKSYWKGSSLNLGDEENNDWLDCDTVGRWKFDQIEPYGGKYYIEYWTNGSVNRLTDLTEEEHDDIRFEILDYLDKL